MESDLCNIQLPQDDTVLRIDFKYILKGITRLCMHMQKKFWNSSLQESYKQIFPPLNTLKKISAKDP